MNKPEKRCKLCNSPYIPSTTEKYCPICLKKHGSGIVCSRIRYVKNNIEKVRQGNRERNNWNNFGFTRDMYEAMLKTQQHRCALCGDVLELNKRCHVNVDHNHKTNKARGIVCHNCNKGLGNFKDDITRLCNAIKYLETYK